MKSDIWGNIHNGKLFTRFLFIYAWIINNFYFHAVWSLLNKDFQPKFCSWYITFYKQQMWNLCLRHRISNLAPTTFPSLPAPSCFSHQPLAITILFFVFLQFSTRNTHFSCSVDLSRKRFYSINKLDGGCTYLVPTGETWSAYFA